MAPTPTPDDSLLTAHDLIVVRTIPADRRLVWRLWTESRHLAEWWGPHGFSNPTCSIEPRAGGQLRIEMLSPAGERYLNVGTVQVAEAPERLVFTVALLGPDGRRLLENLATIEFVDRGAATEVRVRVEVLHATPEARDSLAGMDTGWRESLDRLAELATGGALG